MFILINFIIFSFNFHIINIIAEVFWDFGTVFSVRDDGGFAFFVICFFTFFPSKNPCPAKEQTENGGKQQPYKKNDDYKYENCGYDHCRKR